MPERIVLSRFPRHPAVGKGFRACITSARRNATPASLCHNRVEKLRKGEFVSTPCGSVVPHSGTPRRWSSPRPGSCENAGERFAAPRLSQPSPLPTPQSPSSPWIKLCGWNRPEVLDDVIAGAVWPDAIGLNFYKPSPRYLSPDRARDVVRRLPAAIEAVGLFVDTPPAEIESIATALGLKTLSSTATTPSTTSSRSALPALLRVYRLAGSDLAPVGEDLRACDRAGVRPWRCLVEPKVEGAFGGMGEVGPWSFLRTLGRRLAPLILAGGLTPENVADAIRTVRLRGARRRAASKSAAARKIRPEPAPSSRPPGRLIGETIGLSRRGRSGGRSPRAPQSVDRRARRSLLRTRPPRRRDTVRQNPGVSRVTRSRSIRTGGFPHLGTDERGVPEEVAAPLPVHDRQPLADCLDHHRRQHRRQVRRSRSPLV